MIKNLKTLKSTLIMLILLISMVVTFTPTASAGLIDIQPTINITYEELAEKVTPLSDGLEINLSTTLKLTGFGANFVQNSLFSILKDKSVIIDLSVEETPDWAQASLTNTSTQIKLSEIDSAWESNIKITAKENASAFTTGVVKINATSKLVSGFLFNILEKTKSIEIPFEVGYYSAVDYELSQGNHHMISPYNSTKIPINITNLGNGDTTVEIELVESIENFTINIPDSVTLDAFDGEEQIFLEISADTHEFENRSIQFNFTAICAEDSDIKGQTQTLTFTVENDGSYEEPSEDMFEIDTTLLAVILVVLILVIIVVVFFLRKR